MQLTMNPAIADARDTFDALLQSHRKIVFKVAASYATSVEDRADLAQEIAAQLWRAYPAYDESRAFSTWMYRIALNVAISEFRIASRKWKKASLAEACARHRPCWTKSQPSKKTEPATALVACRRSH